MAEKRNSDSWDWSSQEVVLEEKAKKSSLTEEYIQPLKPVKLNSDKWIWTKIKRSVVRTGFWEAQNHIRS